MTRSFFAAAVASAALFAATPALAQTPDATPAQPEATTPPPAQPTPVPPGTSMPPIVTEVTTGAMKLKVSGLLYLFYRYDLTENAEDYNAFDVSRAYLTFEPSFGDDVSARVTTDLVRQNALTVGTNGKAVNTDGSEMIRLKYAFVSWKPAKPVELKVGLQQTPFTPFEEDTWGYRVLGAVVSDASYEMPAADFGASAIVKLAPVEAHVGVYNGEGFSEPEANKYKTLMARVTGTVLRFRDEPGLRLTGYYQYGIKRTGEDRIRAIGMLSWNTRQAAAGFEYYYAQETGAAGEDYGGGPSAWVWVHIPVRPVFVREARLLGRVDVVDPDHATKKDGITRLFAGVAFRWNENVQAVLDYQEVDPENAATRTTKSVFLHWQAGF